MNSKSLHFALVLTILVSGPILGKALTPMMRLSEQRGDINLDKAMPATFGQWSAIAAPAHIITGDMKAVSDKIYSKIFSRTYTDNKGEQIMLVVAYGPDQRDGFSVHLPEVCYPAQGFQVVSDDTSRLPYKKTEINLRRLVTSQRGLRNEIVAYWVLTGDYRTVGRIEKKLAEFKHALRGEVPDGLLFRVSTISNDPIKGKAVLSRFITQALDSVNPEVKERIMGKPVFSTE